MRITALLFAVVVIGEGAASTELTFHHIHYRVGDPSEAMGAAVRRFSGTRVVVPGLGVGVRIGREYLLFDRADGSATLVAQPAFADGFRAAQTWLAQRMFVIARAEPPGIAMPDHAVDHIAFAAASSDFEMVTTQLATAPRVHMLERREDSALFDVNGIRIEIVRDTARPDVFWCPMHPDARAPDAGKCPVCGMDLVPIPPPVVGEYRLEVLPRRAPDGRGIGELRLVVREPDTNLVVTRFMRVHERPFHLFIVSRDLEYFEHVHPLPRPDGSLVLEQAIPPGEYMLIADFLPDRGTPQMVQRALIAPGPSATTGREPPQADAARRAIRDGLAVTLEVGDLAAGREAPMTFTVTNAADGTPVTDLAPYLGAPAHMLIVKRDLSDAIHAHPEEQQSGGPTVSFHPLMPAAGDYKLWIQFQRGGRVTTFPFWLRVPR